jgi:hypothetical protein
MRGPIRQETSCAPPSCTNPHRFATIDQANLAMQSIFGDTATAFAALLP